MAKRNREEQILENLKIENIAAEGKCIAHVDGMVVFVEYAVPGDVVNARVMRKKKNFAEARIIEIVKPSEYRQKPFCEHFGICGGCRWQLIPYQMQLDSKRQQVADQFRHIGHLSFPEVSPTIGSDKTEFYRNKLEFTASDKRWILPDEDPEGLPEDSRQGLGFHVGKFFDKVLDIRKCYLQPEPSNAIRLYIKQYAIEHGIPFYSIRENTGIFRNMFVRTTDDGQVMLIVCFAADFEGREVMLDAIAEQFPQITSLYYIINSKLNDSIGDQECILYRGDEAIYETMEGLRFRIGPKSFYQTNNGQALKLYSVAREFAALSGSEVVYDLYTGTGTIAQFVSRRASRVIGIEYVPEAIEDAKINARGNGIDNCEFFAGDMKDILTDEFIAEHGHPDVIIADPPRAGMHPDVIAIILNAAPERIVYVSCNPASQARDLEALCTKYEITAVQPVDMFPHTTHVENVCSLVLKTPEINA